MDAAQVEPGKMSPYGALPVPRMTPELLSLIKTGKVYSLGIPHFEGLPRPGAMVPFTLTPRLRHGDLDAIAPASAAAETITMPVHTATHIDALCHITDLLSLKLNLLSFCRSGAQYKESQKGEKLSILTNYASRSIVYHITVYHHTEPKKTD